MKIEVTPIQGIPVLPPVSGFAVEMDVEMAQEIAKMAWQSNMTSSYLITAVFCEALEKIGKGIARPSATLNTVGGDEC